MVIDAHVHITSPHIISNMEGYRAKEPYFDLLSGSQKNKNVTAEELICDMDKDGVGRSIVFGFGFRDQDNCRRANDYTIEALSRFPDRLVGFATINPGADGVRMELERCKASGLAGVGEIMPMGQELDITDKEVMEELCDFCAENNWPLLVHVNELVGHYYPGKTPDSIHEAECLATNFPDTTIIFAHMGGGLCFFEAMPELRKQLGNVYYDTAALPFLYDATIFDALKQMGLLSKLIYGSDYPLLKIGRFRKMIETTSLTAGERADFFGNTAGNLLGRLAGEDLNG